MKLRFVALGCAFGTFGSVVLYYMFYLGQLKASQLSLLQERQNGVSGHMSDRNHQHRHNWTELFHFVPNAIQSCEDLWVETRNKKELFPPEFQDAYKGFLSAVKHVSKVKEGYSAKYIEEFITMYRLVKAPFVRTVCETGFNAGHSTFLWLQANSKTQVYSFDIGSHGYSRKMAEHIRAAFPGRFNITWGDSTITLPAYRKAHPEVTCDMIVIDGGHTRRVCGSDYENFRKMASSQSIVFLDNYPDKRFNLGNVWERAKIEGEICEMFRCNYWPKKPHGFSVGLMNVH